MKNIALASVIALSSFGLAQQQGNASPWSGSLYYDIRTAKANAVVLNKFLDLTINGKPTRFSLYGFAGTSVDGEGNAVGGLAFGREFHWFDQVSIFAGAGISFSGGNPVGGGVLAGVSFKF